jgi:hypothetical protein
MWKSCFQPRRHATSGITPTLNLGWRPPWSWRGLRNCRAWSIANCGTRCVAAATGLYRRFLWATDEALRFCWRIWIDGRDISCMRDTIIVTRRALDMDRGRSDCLSPSPQIQDFWQTTTSCTHMNCFNDHEGGNMTSLILLHRRRTIWGFNVVFSSVPCNCKGSPYRFLNRYKTVTLFLHRSAEN